MINVAVELRLLAFPASKIVLNKRGTGVIHHKKFVSTLLIATLTLALAPLRAAEEESNSSEPSFSGLISNPRQLTFAGRRSGEGYFSADGDELVFQSEREPGNPFFQIYVLDLETGGQTPLLDGVPSTFVDSTLRLPGNPNAVGVVFGELRVSRELAVLGLRD